MNLSRTLPIFALVALMCGSSGCRLYLGECQHRAPHGAAGCDGELSTAGEKSVFDCIAETLKTPPDDDPLPWPRFHPVPTRPVFAPVPPEASFDYAAEGNVIPQTEFPENAPVAYR